MFARTGDEGAGGISAFVVEGDSPGLSAEPLRTMGMPGWKLGAPKFEDVEVPHENLLGREGDGFKIAMMTFDRSRPTVAAQAVGVGQGAIDLAMDYAARRETMGEPLLAHQGLQFKLAGMEADVAAARALTFQAATFVAEGDPRMTKLSAMAKLVASDTAMRVTTEAVQVLGGNGYLKDFPAERMMRDAKVLQIYEGANEIQRLVIARQMAKALAEREPVWPEIMPGRAGRGGGRLDLARPQAERDGLQRPRAPRIVLGIGLVRLNLPPALDREALIDRDARRRVAVLDRRAAGEQRGSARALGARSLVVRVVALTGVMREDDPVLDVGRGELEGERCAAEADPDERERQRELRRERRGTRAGHGAMVAAVIRLRPKDLEARAAEGTISGASAP